MSVTIFEALLNAHYNICKAQLPIQLTLGKDQLNNAVTLLEKGYKLTDEVEPLLDKYGEVSDVPNMED